MYMYYDASYDERILAATQKLLSKMLIGCLPLLLLGVLASVLLGLCVYAHAHSTGNRKAAMWGVLSGFFNIAALVYLIVQIAVRPKPLYCMRCGCPLQPSAGMCPQCGAPQIPTADALDAETAASYKKRSRILLVIWIVIYVALSVLAILWADRLLDDIWNLASLAINATL